MCGLSRKYLNGETTICGLVGVAGNLFQPDIKVFNEMLFADFLRGSHATGVASVRGRSTELLKRAWNPLDLMAHKNYNSVVSASSDVLIGHNRHGTIGDNGCHTNAHPFDFQNVVGAHNGTLDRGCVRNLHNNASYGTDSEALYAEISQNGIDEAFTKIEGAWALTYFDKTERTINFVRNHQRPLFYGFKKGRSVLYWSSEFELLHWILTRNKIEMEGPVYEATTDVLYSVKVGRVMDEPQQRDLAASYIPMWKRPNYKWDSTISDWRMKTEDEIKDDKAKASGGAPFSGPFRGAQSEAEKAARSTKERLQTGTNIVHLPNSEISTGKNITPLDTGGQFSTKSFRREQLQRFGAHTYTDAKGVRIGKTQFEHIMEHSCCAYCGYDGAHYGDPVRFLDSHTGGGWPEFLCEECLSKPEIADLSGVAFLQGKI